MLATRTQFNLERCLERALLLAVTVTPSSVLHGACGTTQVVAEHSVSCTEEPGVKFCR